MESPLSTAADLHVFLPGTFMGAAFRQLGPAISKYPATLNACGLVAFALIVVRSVNPSYRLFFQNRYLSFFDFPVCPSLQGGIDSVAATATVSRLGFIDLVWLNPVYTETWLDPFVLALVFAVLACAASDAPSLNFLAWRPLTLLGEISFGVYVIHFFFVDVCCVWKESVPPVCEQFAFWYPPLTLVAAWLSFTYFEKPVGRLIRSYGEEQLLGSRMLV